MKKLYQILRTAILCVVGVFAGTSVYQYIDYRQRPPIRSYLGPVVHEPPDRCRFYGCGRSDPAYRHENCQTKDEIKKPPDGRLFAIFRLNPSSCTFWFL